MASSSTVPIILAGFSVAFWGLDLLEAVLVSHGQITQLQICGVTNLAAGALLLSAVITLSLTSLLLVAHVRVLGANNAAGGFFAVATRRLAVATLAAMLAALVAGAVLRVMVAGCLIGARSVGWLQAKNN